MAARGSDDRGEGKVPHLHHTLGKLVARCLGAGDLPLRVHDEGVLHLQEPLLMESFDLGGGHSGALFKLAILLVLESSERFRLGRTGSGGRGLEECLGRRLFFDHQHRSPRKAKQPLSQI